MLYNNTFDNSSTAIIEELIRCWYVVYPKTGVRLKQNLVIKLTEEFLRLPRKEYSGVRAIKLEIYRKLLAPLLLHHGNDFKQDVFQFRNRLDEIRRSISGDRYL